MSHRQSQVERANSHGQPSPTAATQVFGELLRYLLVACVALAVDFGSLVALRELAGWHYLPSAAAAFALGLATNYSLSIAWVFANRAVHSRIVEFAIFAAIGLAGLVLTEAILYAGTDLLWLDYRLSKIVSVGVVFAWNFGARKLILFRANDRRLAPEPTATGA